MLELMAVVIRVKIVETIVDYCISDAFHVSGLFAACAGSGNMGLLHRLSELLLSNAWLHYSRSRGKC